MNAKIKLVSILFLTTLFSPLLAVASSPVVKPADKILAASSALKEKAPSVMPVKTGSVEFFALGRPSMLKIHGESPSLGGELRRAGNELTGELKISLGSFTTGMTTRDKHLKEKVFETSKFETATLTITSLSLPAASGVFKDLPFIGKLNLHGVEKEVKGTSQLTVNDQATLFSAHIEVKLTDYQITPPEFMGMSIQNDIKIDAKGETKAQL